MYNNIPRDAYIHLVRVWGFSYMHIYTYVRHSCRRKTIRYTAVERAGGSRTFVGCCCCRCRGAREGGDHGDGRIHCARNFDRGGWRPAILFSTTFAVTPPTRCRRQHIPRIYVYIYICYYYSTYIIYYMIGTYNILYYCDLVYTPVSASLARGRFAFKISQISVPIIMVCTPSSTVD